MRDEPHATQRKPIPSAGGPTGQPIHGWGGVNHLSAYFHIAYTFLDNYLCIHIYTRISAGPSLEGATRLRRGSPVKSSTVTFLSLKSSSSEMKVPKSSSSEMKVP